MDNRSGCFRCVCRKEFARNSLLFFKESCIKINKTSQKVTTMFFLYFYLSFIFFFAIDDSIEG